MQNGDTSDTRFPLGERQKTDKLLETTKRRYDAIFRRAYEIACSDYLENLFDDIGCRRCLEGYKTLLRAIRLYCSVKPFELSSVTFSQVVDILESERKASRRWIEKQMRYMLESAYKTRYIKNLDNYLLSPLEKRKAHLTVVEFSAEIRSHLIFKAMCEMEF